MRDPVAPYCSRLWVPYADYMDLGEAGKEVRVVVSCIIIRSAVSGFDFVLAVLRSLVVCH